MKKAKSFYQNTRRKLQKTLLNFSFTNTLSIEKKHVYLFFNR